MNREERITEQTPLADAAAGEPQDLIAQMRALLYSAANHVRAEQRSEFEAKMREYVRVLDELLAEYEVKFRSSSQQQRLAAQGSLFAMLWQQADIWGKSVRQASNGGWNEIKDEWHAVRHALERKDRQRSFATTDDAAEFKRQLWWMMAAAAHDQENLPLVRQARRRPGFFSAELDRLLAHTEETILLRFYASDVVAEREERAYQQQRADWDSEYSGQYIAIHLGEVIAAHPDHSVLVDLLRRRQHEQGPLRAYVVQIGSPVLDCTCEDRLLVKADR